MSLFPKKVGYPFNNAAFVEHAQFTYYFNINKVAESTNITKVHIFVVLL